MKKSIEYLSVRLVQFIFCFSLILTIYSCSKNQEKGKSYFPILLSPPADDPYFDDEKWGLLDVSSGDIIGEFNEKPSKIVCDVFWIPKFEKEGKCQYYLYDINNTQTAINQEGYISVTEFCEEGFALVAKENEPISIIDTKCTEIAVLPNDIVNGFPFKEGLAAITNKDGNIGFVNTKGEIVIQPILKSLWSEGFSDGLASVMIVPNLYDIKTEILYEDGLIYLPAE